MKITNCRSSVAFVMYCSAAVLVIVNGQPTTDDDVDVDKHEITKLIDTVDKLRVELARAVARIDKLEEKLAASIDKTDARPDESKFRSLT